jgi:hypothetical protein
MAGFGCAAESEARCSSRPRKLGRGGWLVAGKGAAGRTAVGGEFRHPPHEVGLPRLNRGGCSLNPLTLTLQLLLKVALHAVENLDLDLAVQRAAGPVRFRRRIGASAAVPAAAHASLIRSRPSAAGPRQPRWRRPAHCRPNSRPSSYWNLLCKFGPGSPHCLLDCDGPHAAYRSGAWIVPTVPAKECHSDEE